MPRARSSPVKRLKPIGSWGGRRKGAGRKCKLTLSCRRKIAANYLALMQNGRDLGDTPRRGAVIRKLMNEFHITHRMVVRCLDDFLRNTRFNVEMWRYATEGAGVQPLPAEEKEIKKLRSGMYAGKKLRLTVDSTGNRKWSFIFICGSEVREKIFGGSELSLATIRERATKASRMLAAGQSPIDGSWSSAPLRSVKSKS